MGPTGTSSISDPDDMRRIRAELGACVVLSGGIRPVGEDSVAVFTQLVRSSDRVHVWAKLDSVPRSLATSGVVERVVDGVAGVIDRCD